MLNLNSDAKEELNKIDSFDFDIFRLREATNGNEMVTMLLHLLARKGIIMNTNLPFDKFTRFISKIQKGYKNVTYHNKTHGADLCQTYNYFCMEGKLIEKCNMDDVE